MAASCAAAVHCVAPTEHLDLSSSLCANVNASAVASMVDEAHGSKAAFFAAMQRATLPLRISGPEAQRRAAAVRAAPRYPMAHPRVALIGDSITAELFHALVSIAPGARVTFFHVNTIDEGVADNVDFVVPRAQVHVHPAPAGSTLDWAQNDTALWRHLSHERWDAVFVGGMGLHELYHSSDSFSRHWGTRAGLLDKHPLHGDVYSAYKSRRDLVRRRARQLACLSRQLATPFVFIGIAPVDGPVVLLDPPKPDWNQFLDFGLADVVARVEKAVEAAHCAATTAAAGGLDDDLVPTGPGRPRSRGHSSDALLFFHLSDLVRACPGVRCDGIHFVSEFPGYNCFGSLYLLAHFLADFLQRHLPQLLGLGCSAASAASPSHGAAVAAARRSGTPRRGVQPFDEAPRTCFGAKQPARTNSGDR